MAATEVDKSKPVIAAMLKGPGPAKYKLPGTIGFMEHDATLKQMPAFTFGKRFNITNKSCSPGPAYMIPPCILRTGKASAPAYSLYGRQNEKTCNNYPSPGQYSPEKYPLPHSSRAPSYSFGGRVKEARLYESPAPNKYMLPSLIGSPAIGRSSAPAYSICGRQKIGSYLGDTQKTPGPGTYSVCDPNQYLKRGPAYTIKGRRDLIKEKLNVPGPGAYSPEKVWLNKKTGPSFSFGIRHTEYVTMLKDEPLAEWKQHC